MKKLSVLLLLDFSKAFDTLDHEKLLYKLANFGFDANALRLLLNYLRPRFVHSIKNDSTSEWEEVIFGVALLFNIYCRDLKDNLPDDVALFQYADDFQILLDFTIEVSYKNKDSSNL